VEYKEKFQKRPEDKYHTSMPAYLFSLVLISAKNKYPTIKHVLHILNDIYNLSQKASKHERILYDVQSILEEPLLKILEKAEVYWQINFWSITVVKLCYGTIMMICEHIHMMEPTLHQWQVIFYWNL
jgi:hypothetical protein